MLPKRRKGRGRNKIDKRHCIPKKLQYPWTAKGEILLIILWFEGKSIKSINKALGVISQKEQGKHFNLEGKAIETRVYKLLIHYPLPDGRPQYPLYDKMPYYELIWGILNHIDILIDFVTFPNYQAEKRWRRAIKTMKKHKIDSIYAVRVLGGTKEKWDKLLSKGGRESLFKT